MKTNKQYSAEYIIKILINSDDTLLYLKKGCKSIENYTPEKILQLDSDTTISLFIDMLCYTFEKPKVSWYWAIKKYIYKGVLSNSIINSLVYRYRINRI